MKNPTSSPASPSLLLETRYSYPSLLAELELDRNASSFAMEKLDQVEIGKLIQNKKKRRAKKA